jgi:hypothetical protein
MALTTRIPLYPAFPSFPSFQPSPSFPGLLPGLPAFPPLRRLSPRFSGFRPAALAHLQHPAHKRVPRSENADERANLAAEQLDARIAEWMRFYLIIPAFSLCRQWRLGERMRLVGRVQRAANAATRVFRTSQARDLGEELGSPALGRRSGHQQEA